MSPCWSAICFSSCCLVALSGCLFPIVPLTKIVLTGEVPWGSATNTIAVLRKVDRSTRPVLPNDVNAPLRSLIEAMWTGDPGNRPSMGNTVIALQEMSASLDIAQQQGSPAQSEPGTHGGDSSSVVSPLKSLFPDEAGVDRLTGPNMPPHVENVTSELQPVGLQQEKPQTPVKHTNDSLSHLLRRGMDGKLDAIAAADVFRLLPNSDVTLLDLSKYDVIADGANTLARLLPKTEVTALNLSLHNLHTMASSAMSAISRVTTATVRGSRASGSGKRCKAAPVPRLLCSPRTCRQTKKSVSPRRWSSTCLSPPRLVSTQVRRPQTAC